MTNDGGNPNDDFSNAVGIIAQSFIWVLSFLCHSKFELRHFGSRREIAAPEWWSIFGARSISRWNLRRAFRFPSPARRMRFLKRARSGSRLRSIPRAALRGRECHRQEFRRDRKSPGLA